MKKILAFLMILGFASSSCEPDDICDPTTPTTPRMLIKFFKFENASVAKKVNNLKVIGEGMKNEGVVLSPTAAGDEMYLSNADNILLPLNTEADLVKYKFILNYGSRTSIINEDNLEFKYARQNFYVSRACGFKTIFDLDKSNPFILTDSAPADQMWIKKVIVEQNNITDENETIIKIYF